MERKINTKYLFKCLKRADYFGVVRYGETLLLYTSCMILSGEDKNVGDVIHKLIYNDYIKVDDTNRWGDFGIVKNDYRQVKNASEVYHKIINEPRDKASFSYHASVSRGGTVIGYDFYVNKKTKILGTKLFKLFDIDGGGEFEFANESETFVVNGKHIVKPATIYR